MTKPRLSGLSALAGFIARFGALENTFACLGVIALLNVITFYGHYFKDWGFPWDFNMGFHALSYAQVRDYSLGQIRLWQPHGYLGYPWHLFAQNFSFYPPAIALGVFKIEFTYFVSVIFQIFHALFGAIGAYFFARSRGYSPTLSLVAAMAFHMSAGFFSNSQHSDILRGAAYAPWLLLCVTPSVILKRAWAIPLTVFVFVCFFTGSYPGIVIASTHALGAYALFHFFTISRPERWRYLFYLFTAASISILIVSFKFLPLLSMTNEIALVPPGDRCRANLATVFLTLVFDFKGHFGTLYFNDETMRSLFIPPAVFSALFFTNKDTFRKNMDLMAMLVVVATIMSKNPVSDFLIAILPELKLSRMFLSDNRPFLHIPLIMISLYPCVSLSRADLVSLERRLAFFGAVFIGAVSLALYFKVFVSTAYMLALAAAIVFPPLIAVAGLNSGLEETETRKAMTISIGALTVLTGLLFWWNSPIFWQNRDFYGWAKQVWAFDFKEFYALPKDLSAHSVYNRIDTRPPRLSFSHVHQFGLRGYYTGSYTDYAYDAGMRLKRNMRAHDEMVKRPEFMRFMNSESSFIIIRPSEIKDERKLLAMLASEEKPDIGSVKIEYFSDESYAFKVSLNEDAVILENELYFPGWKATASPPSGPSLQVEAVEGPFGLRGWILPKGEFRVTTSYIPPGHRTGAALSIAGLILLFAVILHEFWSFYLKRPGRAQRISS